MRFASYEDMTRNRERRQEYALQHINDLLEQVERLKAIDASQDPRLQIEVSLTIKDIYAALEESPFC